MTGVYRSEADARNEAAVAQLLATAWKCEVHAFAPLSPIDFYAVRGGQLIGMLELKNRTHASTEYATVFLSLRKWLALTLTAVGTGIPGLFVARFTDEVRWINVFAVDGRALRVAGGPSSEHGRNGLEPLIDVFVKEMKKL